MGFKGLFKKKELVKETPVVRETDSGLKYRNIPIIITFNPEQTGEDAYFGQFEFDFESSGEYTADMMEGSAMQVYVKDGLIVKVSGYDI